ncbi:MAG TPA: hypothetical protein P5069_15710, partial [Candidatus Hydrogenedentes bacterium]|nr:hypothetical protein [Candidatus Hydrogenedentota bacterium]
AARGPQGRRAARGLSARRAEVAGRATPATTRPSPWIQGVFYWRRAMAAAVVVVAAAARAAREADAAAVAAAARGVAAADAAMPHGQTAQV